MGPKKNKQDSPKSKNLKKCSYFDRGYCKHSDKCFNFHPEKDKICEDSNCLNVDCDLRHPNPCKFGARCIFRKKNECLLLYVMRPRTCLWNLKIN